MNGEDLSGRRIREDLLRVPDGTTTAGRWVDAGDVRVGDRLLLRDGRILPVQAIRHQPYRDKVYNIHVADFQCYAVGANSILVHNTNGSTANFLQEQFRQALAETMELQRQAEEMWEMAEGHDAFEQEFYGAQAAELEFQAEQAWTWAQMMLDLL